MNLVIYKLKNLLSPELLLKKSEMTFMKQQNLDVQQEFLIIKYVHLSVIYLFKFHNYKLIIDIFQILAKLACGLHKPNRQTILPSNGVPTLFKTLPVKKVRNLGGKLGDVVIDSLKCNVMSDLLRYSLMDLQKLFDEKTG